MVSDFQVARWDFTVFHRLDRVCSSNLQSTKKPKKIRVSSSYPNQSEPLHNLFRVFALLNLRLHRRVKLLVLESSLLEFRVLVISCHAAAAPSSSPIYHFCFSATALNPYPYTTTNPYPYTPTATIYQHRCHILPSYIHHQSFHIRFVFKILLFSNSCFLAWVGFEKKSLETPGQFLGQNFSDRKYFFLNLFLGPRERFETLAIIVIFCRTFSSSLP